MYNGWTANQPCHILLTHDLMAPKLSSLYICKMTVKFESAPIPEFVSRKKYKLIKGDHK